MSNFTVKQKILLAGFAWSVITLGFGLYIYACMERQLTIQQSLEHSKLVTQRFNNMLTIMVDMETGIRGYLLSGEDQYLEPFNAAEGLFDQEAKETADLVQDNPALAKISADILAAKKEWIEGPAVDEMMLRRKFSRGMIDYNAFIEGFKASKGKQISDRVRENVKAAIDLEMKNGRLLADEQVLRSKQAKQSALFGILFAVAVGISLLTLTVSRMNRQIRLVVESLLEQAGALSDLSTHLNQSSSALSQSNAETAEALQKTTAAITQIAAMTDSNEELAKRANVATNECTNTAEKGMDAVQRMIETMGQTASSSHAMRMQYEQNQQKLNAIVERIQEISQKTQVINDIVVQTRLLSFNASVEAARAGEHGKGFAVVAEEVGNLANMSGKASKEISDLLSENESVIVSTIQETSKQLNELVGSIEGRVKEATSRSNECKVAFEEICQVIVGIQSLTKDISNASQEQSRGVNEVSQSMQRIDSSGKSNYELADRTQEFAKTLGASSHHLNDRVDNLYKLFERGPRQSKAA